MSHQSHPLNLHPPFSPEEYAARKAAVDKSMEEAQLDALVITEPENIYYLTGYQTVGAPEVQALIISSTRLGTAPRTPRTPSTMRLVTRKLEATNAARSNLSSENVESYADAESGIEKLCCVVRSVVSSVLTQQTQARCGLEFRSRRLSSEQRKLLESSLETLKEERKEERKERNLESVKESVECLDCSKLIASLRLIKSKAELAIMRRAARICAKGVRAGQSSVEGMTESQIAGRVYQAMCEEGGEYPAYPPFVCAGRNGCIGHYTGSGHHTLREGELLFLEIGGCFERYHAAMMRTCYVGALPEHLAAVERAVVKSMEITMALMKPGAVARDVDAAARQILGKGMSLRSGYSIGIGFYTDWGEAEHFRMDEGSQQKFEENMVVHLIPWVQVPEGAVGLSDTVLITPNGAVSLFDDEIPKQISSIPVPHRRRFGREEALRVRHVLSLKPTPLEKVDFPGLGEVYVKDESKRLGLQAFKVVGGCYAMLRFMCKRLAMPMVEQPEELVRIQDLYAERFGQTTFVTATDGNHGRGVAWAAKMLKQRAVVYMPKGSAQRRLQHVKDLGAHCEITSLNYDDTVELAFQRGREKGWVVLQDTTAPGYTEIPEWIMQGYTAMVDESLQVMDAPSHVLLQMGVGSMAAAVVGHFVARGLRPKFIVLEPANAACGLASARKGKLCEVTGDLETMIAGLACGIPSSIAWPILDEHVSAFVSIEDGLAGFGMRILKRHGIEAGECGGAAAGFLSYVMAHPSAKTLREALDFNAESKVFMINTEGATDPENYQVQLRLPDVPVDQMKDGMLSFELRAAGDGPSAKRARH